MITSKVNLNERSENGQLYFFVVSSKCCIINHIQFNYHLPVGTVLKRPPSLCRFLNKLKVMTAMSAAGEIKPTTAAGSMANSTSTNRAGSSLSNQLPPSLRQQPAAATAARDEGISPPSSPYPAPQIVVANGEFVVLVSQAFFGHFGK